MKDAETYKQLKEALDSRQKHTKDVDMIQEKLNELTSQLHRQMLTQMGSESSTVANDISMSIESVKGTMAIWENCTGSGQIAGRVKTLVDVAIFTDHLLGGPEVISAASTLSLPEPRRGIDDIEAMKTVIEEKEAALDRTQAELEAKTAALEALEARKLGMQVHQTQTDVSLVINDAPLQRAEQRFSLVSHPAGAGKSHVDINN